jgi:hypothetical protein
MVIREQRFSINRVRQVFGGVLDHDLHAKRVDSLCHATLGGEPAHVWRSLEQSVALRRLTKRPLGGSRC